MRVARIPYLNAEPFYAGWGFSPPFEVVDMVPRELGVAAREGTIDAGLMATADYLDLEPRFELVRPAMGVSARRHVSSVVLLSNDRPSGLDRKRIALTTESSTSVRLLKLLARARWGIEPIWVAESELGGEVRGRAAGILLIGDRALDAMAAPDRQGWARTTDLASEWWTWQERPFVFAVWAVAADLPIAEKERFGGFLTGSLAVGRDRLDTIARDQPATRGSPRQLYRYLSHFDYRLREPQLGAIDQFRSLIAEYGLGGAP